MLIGRGRCSLVHHLGCAVGQWAVRDVTVAGHPTDIGGAPVHVGLRFDIEDVVVGVRHLSQVATGGVQDALGLTGGARCVKQEEWVLRVERLGGVFG